MERQRRKNQIREQNRDPEIMESSNLTDTEFKTLVIKMLNELLGSVENSVSVRLLDSIISWISVLFSHMVSASLSSHFGCLSVSVSMY